MHPAQQGESILRPTRGVLAPDGVGGFLVAPAHVCETEIEVYLTDSWAIGGGSNAPRQIRNRGIEISFPFELPTSEEHSLGSKLEIQRHEIEDHPLVHSIAGILDPRELTSYLLWPDVAEVQTSESTLEEMRPIPKNPRHRGTAGVDESRGSQSVRQVS